MILLNTKPGPHATSHQHGGTDEIATATPAANAIPKAGGGGTLDAGWIPAVTGLTGFNEAVDDRVAALLIEGSNIELTYNDGANTLTVAVTGISGGTGDVVGPGSSTDNALARFDGTTGKLLQNSGWILADSGKLKGISSYSDINAATDGSTVTFDLNLSNVHSVTLGGNRTLAISNASIGQRFMIKLKQDATGSRTVTWFSNIHWPGNTAPTLTTNANRWDWFGFMCTGVDGYGDPTFDGFILGQNYQ